MNVDNQLSSVDQEIFDCLNLDKPKSFFLFAGAGSGKTRSLVEVLKKFRNENSKRLKLYGQKVAIITYTNAACGEIKRRLEFDSTFVVSTIHSFAWELIKTFQQDIKVWVRNNTQEDIKKLEEEQKKGRAGTKTATIRTKKIESKNNRLTRLDTITKFTYNPNGDNFGKDSLNHAEVIKMASDFITSKPLMQAILIKKYPILLIDESQDTKRELIESLLFIQSKNSDKFTLGLFGDMMQRIYAYGKADLENSIPDTWAKPVKAINYRSPNRIIELINKIRSEVDNYLQIPSNSSKEGIVRLFIVNSNNTIDKTAIEKIITEKMQTLTNDELWKINSEIKIFTLEHHMAASRGGFIDFFEPLYSIDKYKTGLIDGSLSEISFFIKQILPLIKAKKEKNEFEVANVVKKYSPLLNSNNLKKVDDPIKEILKANMAVKSLFSLWKDGTEPSLLDILNNIKETGLFFIPDKLIFITEEAINQNTNLNTNNDRQKEASLKFLVSDFTNESFKPQELLNEIIDNEKNINCYDLSNKEAVEELNKRLNKMLKAIQENKELQTIWKKGCNEKIKLVKDLIVKLKFDSIKRPKLRDLLEEDDNYKDDNNDQELKIEAWEKALNCSFVQFEAYENYISDRLQFGTHQGVKGLEFPRVMVILDDNEARGFMFNYEKLLGAVNLSTIDIKNIAEKKEIAEDITRRLFYVTCSRAEESLAIVVYSTNPTAIKNNLLDRDWFLENEIIELENN